VNTAVNNSLSQRDIFEDVKGEADLRDIVEWKTGAKMRSLGSKSWGKIPCPLCTHNDCFNVDKNDHIFKCFSCNAGGSVIDFVALHGGCEPIDAAKEVAIHLGFNMADYEPKKKGDKKTSEDPIAEAWEFAASYYAQHRKSCKDAEYLTIPKAEGGRGHKEGSLQRLNVGWGSGKLHQAFKEKGYDDDFILSTGLVMQSEKDKSFFDYFGKGFYIFPWVNEDGVIGYWSAKDSTKKRPGCKLRNDYKKAGVLWGNQKAIRRESVQIVEGEDDLLSMLDAGQGDTLCAMGQVSQDQIDFVVRERNTPQKGPKSLFFWFDRDSNWKNGLAPAGLRYVRKFYQALFNVGHTGINICSNFLKPGEDPDDYIQKDIQTAAARVQQARNQSINPMSYELMSLPPYTMTPEGVVIPEQLINYLGQIEFWQYLSLLPEMHRDTVVANVCSYQISRDAVMGQLKKKASLLHTIEAANEEAGPKMMKEERHQRRIATIIWDSFKMRGLFFVVENKVMLFFGHKIYTIDDNTEFRALVHRECGLNSTSTLYKFIKAELEALCFNQGEHMNQFSWIHREREGDEISLYSNMKDKENRILKLCDGDIKLIENGVNDDKVLLQASAKMEPFTYDASVDVPSVLGDLKRIFLDSISCEMYQRYFVLAHAFAPFFIPFTKAKALLKCEGGSGSGKTTGARFAGLLMMGKDIIGKTSVAAAYSMGSREPMMVFDNIENHNLNLEFLDFLLLVSTGSTRDKRSQGTDSGTVSEELNTIVWITGIEPFSKPELINRTFTLKFDPKYRRKDKALMDDLMDELLEKRDPILSALLQVLAREVLPTIQDRRRYWVNHIRNTFPNHSKNRMDEYIATLMCLIDALLPYLPLTKTVDSFIPDGKNHAHHILEQWLSYQDSITGQIESDSNQVLEALDRFRDSAILRYANGDIDPTAKGAPIITLYGLKVSKTGGYGSMLAGDKNPTVIEFTCSTAQLLTAFKTSAKDSGNKCPFNNASQLAARYSDQRDLLIKSGWTKKHAKKVNGTTHYTLTWVEDIQD
jgi:hypothetical protein